MAETEVDALHKLLQRGQHLTIEGVPVLITPEGFKVETLEKLLEFEQPMRVRRAVDANDVRGFVDYVNRYKDNDTQLYADAASKPSLLARIDDHLPAGPSHNTHKATYGCPQTHEWKTWLGSNGTKFNQVDFAQFIERNARDIIEPAGAELLSAVLNFQDHGSAKFQSAVRLASGRVQFSYIEKDESEKLEFPERLKLGLPVFEGMTHGYPLDVKLRYRIKRDDDSGQLSLWYELDRPDLVLRQAYDDLIQHVTEKTGISVIRAI